jgi:hypothetical protein
MVKGYHPPRGPSTGDVRKKSEQGSLGFLKLGVLAVKAQR